MSIELSIVMPCLNEVKTLPACIRRAQQFLTDHKVEGEVIVADNGSTDGSIEIARELGARVANAPERGYGAALITGIHASAGRFVVMGDSDESYDFSALAPFLEKLREGYDLVMGNRFKGGIAPGAMPPMHRYFGNPFLTAVGQWIFKCRTCGDYYCGLRGFRKEAVIGLQLQSKGMEFALEMVVRASMFGLRICEVPTTLSPDGRDRAPHLRRYRDGWRSLRLYLLWSPRWFFGIPGSIALGLGLLVTALLATGPRVFFGVSFDYHTLLYGCVAIVLGYQSILLAFFAKLTAVEAGLHPSGTQLRFLEERKVLEQFIVIGAGLALIGVILGIVATQRWSNTGFGDLAPSQNLRYVIFSVLSFLLGGQSLLAAFYFGIINLLAERRGRIGAPSNTGAI